MNNYFLPLAFTLTCSFNFAQSNSKWFSYYDADSILLGFKNTNGEILTEPKFMMVSSNEFEDAVAVVEQISEDDFSTYYLRSDGSKFAEDSVYFFETMADNESSGYLRFRSPKTEKVGLMNTNGKIIFPAIYDEMKEVRNDFVLALKGAKKKYWDKHDNDDCDHYSWVGGESLLLFIEGNVIATDFLRDSKGNFISDNFDYSTFESSKKPSADPLRTSFKATKGGYISFVSLDKSFEKWLSDSFLNVPTENQLEKLSMDSLVIWDEEMGWKAIPKSAFFNMENENLGNLIQCIENKNYTHFNSYQEDFFLYEFSMFKQYFNLSSGFNHWDYPSYDVTIENKSTNEQSQMTFLRTDKGWQLVSLSLR